MENIIGLIILFFVNFRVIFNWWSGVLVRFKELLYINILILGKVFFWEV